SSRRRHTRFSRDWSSDVCSSDLGFAMVVIGMLFKIAAFPFHFWAPDVYQGAPLLTTTTMSTLAKVAAMASLFKLSAAFQGIMPEIGRASCRERVEMSGVAVG